MQMVHKIRRVCTVCSDLIFICCRKTFLATEELCVTFLRYSSTWLYIYGFPQSIIDYVTSHFPSSTVSPHCLFVHKIRPPIQQKMQAFLFLVYWPCQLLAAECWIECLLVLYLSFILMFSVGDWRKSLDCWQSYCLAIYWQAKLLWGSPD